MTSSPTTRPPDLFEEVFEGFTHPVGVCGAQGEMVVLNAAAKRMLGVVSAQGVVLGLEGRDTLSTLKFESAGQAEGMEFFLADVPLHGVPGRAAISVSLQPLSRGQFRVSFLEDESRQESPSSRVLRALGQVSEHVPLFGEQDQLLSLLASALAETFPDYAFRIELAVDERVLEVEVPYAHSAERTSVAQIVAKVPGPGRHQLLWKASRTGYQVGQGAMSAPPLACRVQVETHKGRGLSGAEREAVLIFAQFVQFFAQRQHDRLAPGGLGHKIEFFAPLFDQLEAAIALCDARRLIRSCNGAFLRLIQQEAGRPDGTDVLACFDPADHASLRAAAALAMSGAQAGPLEISWPVAGSTHPLMLEVRLAPLGAPGPHPHGLSRGFILVAQPSQSNLMRLEERFVQADHLMELGQLATGVAHELKNPLTSILNYADYLLQKYRDHLFEQRDKERLVRIIEGVEQIDHFVRDLLAIARPEAAGEAVSVVQVHEVVRRAGRLCEATFEACGARLELAFAATSPLIEGRESQLVQVFVNLLENAATALPEEGGVITVATHQEGHELVVTLKDQGCGMTKEQVAQMFEPFYTTRRATGGTGLGLVLVRSIVARHQGQIQVQSHPGQGTTFVLRFPRHVPTPA